MLFCAGEPGNLDVFVCKHRPLLTGICACAFVCFIIFDNDVVLARSSRAAARFVVGKHFTSHTKCGRKTPATRGLFCANCTDRDTHKYCERRDSFTSVRDVF